MKVLFILLAVSIAVLLGYYVMFADKSEDKKDAISIDGGTTSTYNVADGGIAFDYKTGVGGYVVEERMPVDIGEEPIKVILLMQAEDAKNEPPIGGEGPPVVSVALYTNKENLSPKAWAEKNPQHSNVNLVQGAISDITVAGASAIRYMADGLYASENVVVANNGMIYVITGQFIDQNSDIRLDFPAFVESIRFI